MNRRAFSFVRYRRVPAIPLVLNSLDCPKLSDWSEMRIESPSLCARHAPVTADRVIVLQRNYNREDNEFV
jgi:hypothetical protein